MVDLGGWGGWRCYLCRGRFVGCVVGGCGWCIWGVLLLCGFSTGLVGVVCDSAVRGVLLLWGCLFTRFTLLETQLCVGRCLDGGSGTFSVSCLRCIIVFWLGWCGFCCGFEGGIVVPV